MPADPDSDPVPEPAGVLMPLMPVMLVLFVAYLVIGITMPALPLHVNQGMGLSPFVVGVVGSTQFAAALFSRFWAGAHSDARGPKNAMIAGLLTIALSGVAYLVSLQFAAAPHISVAVLMVGRLLLGIGQSFIVMGSMSWGLTLAGPANTGKVMAWMGIALYAAVAIGAPIGTALYEAAGFFAIALASILAPVATLLLIARLQPVPGVRQPRAAFTKVAGAVWLPGLGLALSVVGFGAITTFIALLYVERGWDHVWLAFTTTSLAFIFGRVVLGHLPDRIGGARVAAVCVLIEVAGQLMIWQSPSVTLTLVGVALTGFGYALVYPGFGVEAIRRAPAQNRGLAMGAFTAFYDLSLGVSGPLLGLAAGAAGIGSVFLVSAVAAIAGAMIAAWLVWRPQRG